MPAPELRFWGWYFSRVPPPEERIEIAVARLEWMYSNANRDRQKQPEPRPLSDFLSFSKAFDPPGKAEPSSERYSDADRAMMRGLMG
jgi:hypothetical protein